MKQIILLMALWIVVINANAQNWAWARKAGGTSADYGYSIKKGAGSFIYTCGQVTSSSGTFGAHSFSGVVGSRGWIALQNQADGTYSPPIFPTGTGESAFLDMDVDTQGNAYVTGYFTGTLTFGTKTIQGDQTRSMFIAKMRSDGNWAWAYRLTYSSNVNSQNTGDAILVSPDGTSIFVGGRSHQGANSYLTNADAFANLFSIDNQDGYIAKYDSLGNYQWAIRVNALGTVQGPATCNNLQFDGQGNVVASGEWTGAISNMQLEGPQGNTTVFAGITNANSKKAFLTKFNAGTGSISFAINAFNNATLGGFLGGVINGLAVDKTDNRIYLACTQANTAGALIKYNATADTVIFYNNNSQIYFNNVTLDSANLPVVCGYMSGSQVTVAGNTYTNAGGIDMFIGRLSKTSGTWDKFQRAGGAQDDYASDVLAVGNTIYMLASGSSLQTNFDGLTALTNSTVNFDIYTARINLPAPCIAPDITQEPLAVTVCGGQPFSVSVTATGNNITYQWQKGGVNLSGNGANTATYSIASSTASDAGNYRCIVSNSCGADTSLVVAVTVNVASVSISGISVICQGVSGQLTASGTGTYNWSNGLGTNATVTVSPATTTTYTVTVTGPGSCTATASRTVNVLTTPTPTITGTATICSGTSTTLTASGGDTYEWSNGLGTNAQITVSPTQTTTYEVTAIAANSCIAATTFTVSVLPSSSTVLNETICFGNTFVFNGNTLTTSGQYTNTLQNALGCDSIITLNLTVLPELTSSFNQTICNGDSYTFGTQTLTQAGTYTEVFSSVNGCDSTVTLNLSIAQPVQITQQPIASSTSVCAGESVTLNVTAIGDNLSYQWKEGTTNVGTNSSSYTAANLTQGTKTYSVVVSNTCGSETSNSVTVTVNALPTPTITQSGNMLSTQAFSNYQWQLNGNNISGATNQTHTATQNGNYTVVVTDANGCSNTSSTVNVTGVGITKVVDFRNVIYPNPATIELTVEADEMLQSIVITDVIGKTIVGQSEIFSLKSKIDVSRLAESTYFIRITTTTGKTVVKPFVKN